MNIYISNLSYNIESNDLLELFQEYGEVTSAKVITDRESGRSRGFGFVEMASDEAGEKAISELDQAEYDGKVINVAVARPKTDAPRRSFNGGGNRGGGQRFDRGGDRGGFQNKGKRF